MPALLPLMDVKDMYVACNVKINFPASTSCPIILSHNQRRFYPTSSNWFNCIVCVIENIVKPSASEVDGDNVDETDKYCKSVITAFKTASK